MKYLKNNLMKAIFVNLWTFGTLTILTIVLSNNAFGQDLSRIFAPQGATVDNEGLTKNINPGCVQYELLIETGDLEGADADANVFVTIHGTNGDTDRIKINGEITIREDKAHPVGSTCLEFMTPRQSLEEKPYKALTFVRWGSNLNVVNSMLNQVGNFFIRNKTAMVTINTHDVGTVESITLEHDNWYPAWYLKSLTLYKGDNRELAFQRDVNRWFREDSLKQTFKVNESGNVTDYRIKVFTGDVYQAGTNSKVYLTLNGRQHVIPNIDLAKLLPGTNPFERNQTDETGIYDQPLNDGLSSITINLEKGARWFLGSITIDRPRSSFSDIFRYNNWIEGGQPVTIYPTEARVSPTRKITFRSEAGYSSRMLIQYFENGAQGALAPKMIFSADMPPGQNSVIEIPQDVKDAKVFLIGSGTVNDNFYTSNFTGYLAGDPCFKAWGTFLSPQGGTCDGNPISTTTLNPITPSLYPKTVAEGEQGCFDMMQSMISKDTSQKLRNLLDESSIKRLCKGTKDPNTTTLCYGVRVIDISSENAIAECSGQIPLGSTPKIGTTTTTSGANVSNTNIAQNEQDCFNQVQGKVAYDTAGNKVWNENNIKSLCRGTTNPPATIACFSQKMPQIGWAKASQECAATNISSQTQRVNQMPVPSQNQPTSRGISLEGNWVMYDDKGVKFDKFAKISQSGANLSINNGYGANSTAVLNGNSLKTSDGLTGTISADGNKINWNINYVWVKQVSAATTNYGQVSPNQTPINSPNTLATTSLKTARDIDAKNGVVWAIGTNSVPGGYGIYKFNDSSWTQIDGGATRIAVDQSGNPWIINSVGTIFRRINDAWTEIPGMRDTFAADIAVAGNGNVWVVTTSGLVSRWTGSGWTPGRALQAKQVIALPNSNAIQIVENSGKRWTGESEDSWLIANDPTGLADKYLEFAVDGDTKWVIDSSFNIQRLSGGQSQGNYVINETQVQPTSQITNAPTPTKRSITFRNEAGFVAKMLVQYFESGPNGISLPKFLFTDNLPVGQSKTLEIPNSATNTQIVVSLIGSGTMKDNFFSTSIDGGFTGNRCFKAWGTLFSPQGGTCQ
ncbi:MAG: hypothetical protein K1X72_15470 [Pyrinomonadaceae bacterium]|nr:hypothetical protein [Pyrinomonadaceae bacterium]